jgi:RNA polymerase sigma factor (sigma-70 family)
VGRGGDVSPAVELASFGRVAVVRSSVSEGALPASSPIDALGDLYRACAAQAFGYLVRLVRDRSVAEDLLQDAFVRVARRLDTLREPGAARAYLFRAATNLAIDRVRSLRRRRDASLDAAPEPSAAPASDGAVAAEARDDVGCMRFALETLEPRDRAALLLRFVHGFRLADVGDAIGLTDRGAARVVEHALARLRRRLSPSPSLDPCCPENRP